MYSVEISNKHGARLVYQDNDGTTKGGWTHSPTELEAWASDTDCPAQSEALLDAATRLRKLQRGTL